MARKNETPKSSKKRVTRKTTAASSKAPAAVSRRAAPVKKVELKTKATSASVDAFIDAVAGDERRADCRTLIDLMSKASKSTPRLWGPTIVGFGETTLTYASGRTLDWFHVGFSPRKGDLSIYLHSAFPERADCLKRLGPHKTGVACLYVKRLADIDLKVLREMVKASVRHSRTHGGGC